MNVNFTEAIRVYFQKYATFSGRATRAEYWWVMLAFFIFSWLMNILPDTTALSALTVVVNIGCIVPTLALTTRRLHDVGLSGWWLFAYYAVTCGLIGWVVSVLIGAGVMNHIAAGMTPDHIAVTLFGVIGMLTLPAILGFVLYVAGIVVMCLPSKPANKYGPDPYAVAE